MNKKAFKLKNELEGIEVIPQIKVFHSYSFTDLSSLTVLPRDSRVLGQSHGLTMRYKNLKINRFTSRWNTLSFNIFIFAFKIDPFHVRENVSKLEDKTKEI